MLGGQTFRQGFAFVVLPHLRGSVGSSLKKLLREEGEQEASFVASK